MTYVIEVSADVERRLREQAAKLGIKTEEYLNRLVENTLGAVSSLANSGSELVACWRNAGVIGAWAKRTEAGDSVGYAQSLRRQAESRRPE